MPTDTTDTTAPPHQPNQRQRSFRILLRFLDLRDPLNLALQLILGTVLVALLDLRLLPQAAQQVSATAQSAALPTTVSWPLLAIPIVATVGWFIVANVILRQIFAPSQPPQPPHHSAPPTHPPTHDAPAPASARMPPPPPTT